MEVGFAQRARELLEAGGLDVAYRESDIGHQIDPRTWPTRRVVWRRNAPGLAPGRR